MIRLSASRVAALIAAAFMVLLLLVSRGHLIDDIPVAPLAALLWLFMTLLLVARWIRRREIERQASAGDKAVTLSH